MNEKELRHKFKYLIELLNEAELLMRKESDRSSKKATIYKVAMISLSSFIPFVLGIKESYSSNVALFLSSILAIIVGVDQFLGITSRHFDFKKRYQILSRINFELNLYVCGNENLEVDKYNEFIGRFDDLRDHINERLDVLEANSQRIPVNGIKAPE